MATARDDGMLDLLSDKCGSAYEMYENYLYIYSPKEIVLSNVAELGKFIEFGKRICQRQWRDMRDEFRGTEQET